MKQSAIIKMTRREVHSNNEPYELLIQGSYVFENDVHLVSYYEYDDETKSRTLVNITFDSDSVTINKVGNVKLDMKMGNGNLRHESKLITQYGTFPIVTISKNYECEEIRGLFIINLLYNQIIGDEIIGDVELKIHVVVNAKLPNKN